MNHPLDRYFNDLMKATEEGPDAMANWLKNLQEEVGAPDGMDLPDEIELEYSDGTTETIDTTKPLGGQGRFPVFYSFDNPAPQEVLDRWAAELDGEEE